MRNDKALSTSCTILKIIAALKRDSRFTAAMED